MACSQPGGADSQQQTGRSIPEAVWLPYLEEVYPNIERQTYFLPPFHFYRVPFTVNTITGLTACVTAAYCQDPQQSVVSASQPGSPQQTTLSPSPSAQQAPVGAVFTENPPNLQPVSYQDSDRRDDQAQQKCLRALRDISGETMMVVSQLHFKQYLDNKMNPDSHRRHLDAIKKLPASHNLPAQLADGDCDVLIIHRHYGLLVGEVKSVGDDPSFADDRTIVKKVAQAVRQLNNQETVLKHLLKDLPKINITKTVLLPNVTSSQLRSALTSSVQLSRDLRGCTKTTDMNQAISRCLCSDYLGHPSDWWQKVWTASPFHLSLNMYKRLVARFCGVATTVDIPTASPPRIVVRSLGQAVAETGLRFSTLVLTPPQVDILDAQSEPPCLYLQGPPGCGKTVVLVLKALQWAQQGRKEHAMAFSTHRLWHCGQVAVVHQPGDAAVATLIEEQLRGILGAAAATTTIHRHCSDFGGDDLDVSADVASLRQQLGPGDVHIIIDEVPWSGAVRHFIPWVTEVRNASPQLRLWMAGVKIRDDTARDQSRRLPSWVKVRTLQEPLRCPPAVISQVAQSSYIDGSFIPRYLSPAQSLHTEGPPVRRVQHEGKPGHTGGVGDWLQCTRCTDVIADLIKEMRAGQTGQALQYRDVWILAAYGEDPCVGDVMVERLQQHYGLPVYVVGQPLSAADAWELAMAVTDHITVTAWRAVQGLERRVVISLGDYYQTTSRSTSLLLCIK